MEVFEVGANSGFAIRGVRGGFPAHLDRKRVFGVEPNAARFGGADQNDWRPVRRVVKPKSLPAKDLAALVGGHARLLRVVVGFCG
ncbi:MAG: hypothetical protein UZ18_ATM001000412 [Armatimonadetes bacterium OLB18]|nr:MAG: hypothetical protein UZ18_ATM001000412 [Armatimonadetes bacterium OLB18]